MILQAIDDDTTEEGVSGIFFQILKGEQQRTCFFYVLFKVSHLFKKIEYRNHLIDNDIMHDFDLKETTHMICLFLTKTTRLNFYGLIYLWIYGRMAVNDLNYPTFFYYLEQLNKIEELKNDFSLLQKMKNLISTIF
ncbi:hypothetical protein ACJX0J_035383, partial [Zea mays]